MKRGSFVRFNDLMAGQLDVELHVHTTWTDGTASVEAVLQQARADGLRTMAITEHVRRGSEEWFPGFARDVRQVAEAFPELTVLVGCEAKALATEGTASEVLDVGEKVLCECDLVLGSVHRFPDGKGGVLNFADLDAASMAETETELAISLLRFAPIDVLAHPGGMYSRRHGPFPLELMRRIFAAAAERDIAVEINSSYLREVAPFLDLCRELNPRVSIGSDAHKLGEIGCCRRAVASYLGTA